MLVSWKDTIKDMRPHYRFYLSPKWRQETSLRRPEVIFDSKEITNATTPRTAPHMMVFAYKRLILQPYFIIWRRFVHSNLFLPHTTSNITNSLLTYRVLGFYINFRVYDPVQFQCHQNVFLGDGSYRFNFRTWICIKQMKT